jgi:hypothetical protein
MTLQDIFDALTFGELSQLSIGGGEAGVIAEANYPKVVSHIGLGLTALYKRFRLKSGRVVIKLQPGRITYNLNSNEDVYFVTEAFADEFADDILKIEQVYTADGAELVLNDWTNEHSCHTMSSRVLRLPMDLTGHSGDVPEGMRTDTLLVAYRANHPAITIGASFNPSRVEMELPDSHLEALLLYVASRANNPIGMTNEFHAGNSYYTKYLSACTDLETENLQIDNGGQNTRLRRNGWV